MHTPSTVAVPTGLRNPARALLAVLSVAAVPVWLYLQLFREALIDDTFITLQYVRTLRDDGVWGFFPWETTNTATSPLNVLLTAGTGLVVPDLVQAALLLATIEALLLFGTLLLLSQHIFDSPAFGVLSFLALLLNPLLISTLGLESLLYTTLFMACIYAVIRRRWAPLAVLLALLTLTRPDGCLLFPIVLRAMLVTNQASGPAGPPAAHGRSCNRSFLRSVVRFCCIYLLCLLPWYLFSWIHLGSLVPTTLLIKRAQGTWEGYHFLNGVLFYYQRYPGEVAGALLLAPFALLCLRLKNRHASLVAGMVFWFSALYFIAYAVLGVPPYHWYFVPVVIPWSVLGVLGLTARLQGRGSQYPSLTRIGVYTLPCLIAFAGLLFLTNGSVPLEQSPIHTNWATHNRYRDIGRWLRDHVDAEANIEVRGEIGTVAYYSERRLVDVFSCRVQNRDLLTQIEARRGISRLVARMNFFWLQTDTACTPSTYTLVMYNTDPARIDLPPHVMEQWLISTDWVAHGRVVLARQ